MDVKLIIILAAIIGGIVLTWRYYYHVTELFQKKRIPMSQHISKMLDEMDAGEAILLDVREQHEWDAGHLSLAQLVPLSELRKGKGMEALQTSANMKVKAYLYCRAGRRVHIAKPLLTNIKFKKIIPLAEGYQQLKAMGISVTEPAPAKHKAIRQWR